MLSPELRISAIQDLPFAIFVYDPNTELELRREVQRLATRLRNNGKKVTVISLSDIFWNTLKEKRPLEAYFKMEEKRGLKTAIETISGRLTNGDIFEQKIVNHITDPFDSQKIVFLIRIGALFPVYRVSSLLENLGGKLKSQTVLFYPGKVEGTHGLRFMGITEPNYNYRQNIY